MRATTMASAIALALCVGAHAHVIVTAKGGVGAQSCAWRTRIATLGSLRNCVMHEAPASPPVSSPFAAGGKPAKKLTGPLPLTLDNVEMVLDEMRPYLLADGGNVAVREIEGPNVFLELQGACGTCPSSTMTMKMGLERGLKEKIPEIASVVQVPTEGTEELTDGAVEAVLEEVRPFLAMAGGSIELISLVPSGIAPTCTLKMSGSGSALTSVKVEIQQRLKRKLPALVNIMWE